MKNYLKDAAQVCSLVFTLLVALNLFTNKAVLFQNIEYFLFIALVSGLLSFLVENNERYSNRRLLLNQVGYLLIIFGLIIGGNYYFQWSLGIKGLSLTFISVTVMFFLVKFIMFRQDKREAAEINNLIKTRKQAKS